MSQIKYTADHEWVRTEDDGSLTVGITPYATEQLGDIVYVQLPDVGSRISVGEEAVVIESVKAAADIKMPVGGEVIAVNESLNESPETVNEDPLRAGWFLKIRPDGGEELSGLLDQSAYDRLTEK
jgi:glycine cleavage system H protein